MTDCETCNGTGWVCENHPLTPWGQGADECDCGAGMPCACNPNGELEWQAVIASTEPSEVKTWAQ